MSIYERMLDKAIKNNELKNMFLGMDWYKMIDDDFDFNAGANLAAIYKYYNNNPNSGIDKKLIETLESMMNEDPFEILVTFYYTQVQVLFEIKNFSSFKLPEEYYKKLRKCILKNRVKLEQFSSNEFGADGMGYINNINEIYDKEKGRRIIQFYQFDSPE